MNNKNFFEMSTLIHILLHKEAHSHKYTYAHAYLFRGDQRRDVRGDRRRVHFSRTLG